MRLSIVVTFYLLWTFLMGCGSTQPEVNTSTDIQKISRPPQVDVNTWNLLTNELIRQLPAKTSVSAPIGTANEVDDLTLVVEGSQATLTWSEKLRGDYDNNGEVNASDLTPIAMYYLLRSDTGPDDGRRLVEGDASPTIDIYDITPIAINYQFRLDGYQVWRSLSGGDWVLLPNANSAHDDWSLDRPYPAPISARPSYQYVDGSAEVGARYKVVAYGDNEAGAESNVVEVVEMANLPPIAIASAEPTSGTAPLSVRLDGSGSSDADGEIVAYVWTGNTVILGEGVVLDYVFAEGEHSVTLGVKDDDDAVDYSTPILISVIPAENIPPVADLTANPSNGDSPLLVTLDASASSDIDGAIVSYAWDFDGDGEFDFTSSESTFEHTYTEGEHNPIVRVTDDDGATDTDTTVVTVAEATVAPGDWWMFGHDAQHTSRSPFVGPQTATLYWSYPTDGEVNSSPVLDANGNIYIGSNDGYLYAVKPDGSPKWRVETIGFLTSAPAIGDMVIYATDRGGDGWFGGLNFIRPDGSIEKRSSTFDAVVSSPAIGTDGAVYFGSLDNFLYAIKPNGTQKWPRYDTGGQISSSPAIDADGVVYIGGSSSLFAINPDGSLKWEYPVGDSVYSSPAIDADGVVYVGGGSSLLAINPDSTLKWDYPTGNYVISAPAIGEDGTIYVGSDDANLYAIDADGAEVWSYPTGGAVKSSPAIGADGTIYVGSDDWKMYAINPDGSGKWDYLTDGRITSSPAIGENGTLYFGSQDGYLYAIRDN